MTISTQNNHKNDNARANDPESTIQIVDSSKEKTKHTSCSEHVAAGTAASEVEKIPKSSLKSSLSANTFDTKPNNSARSGEKSLKHKSSDKDEVQVFSSKARGKQNTYANSNLKNASKDKASIASFAPVSTVRSLNSPIHQKPHAIPNKAVSESPPSYPIPLHTPPPPVISTHSKRNESVSASYNKCNLKEIESKNNQEAEPLFRKDEGTIIDDKKNSSQIEGFATKPSEDSLKLGNLHSTKVQCPDTGSCNAYDIKPDGDGKSSANDNQTNNHVDLETLQQSNKKIFSSVSDSCEIPSKNESDIGVMSEKSCASVAYLPSNERTSPVALNIKHDKTTVTHGKERTAVSGTTHGDETQLLKTVVSE